MKNLLLTLTSSIFLLGCATAQAPIIEVRYKTIAVSPPDDLLINCDTVPPPTVSDYLALKNWTDREGILVENIASNEEKLGVCNTRLEQIRKWKLAADKAVMSDSSASAPIKSP